MQDSSLLSNFLSDMWYGACILAGCQDLGIVLSTCPWTQNWNNLLSVPPTWYDSVCGLLRCPPRCFQGFEFGCSFPTSLPWFFFLCSLISFANSSCSEQRLRTCLLGEKALKHLNKFPYVTCTDRKEPPKLHGSWCGGRVMSVYETSVGLSCFYRAYLDWVLLHFIWHLHKKGFRSFYAKCKTEFDGRIWLGVDGYSTASV